MALSAANIVAFALIRQVLTRLCEGSHGSQELLVNLETELRLVGISVGEQSPLSESSQAEVSQSPLTTLSAYDDFTPISVKSHTDTSTNADVERDQHGN